MDDVPDQQLLRDYWEQRSERAFAELVRRHVDLVFSAALRMVRDSSLAEDVSQGVFVALAQNARLLTDRPVLSGWLHNTARNLASKTVRSEVRRRTREQEAALMNDLLSPETEAPWEEIAPQLDAALSDLEPADRDALLLRFFERKSAREMAPRLGVSDEAAQKRVNRAVERLRQCFAARGVRVGAGGLAVVLSANAVQAAPASLPATICTAAAAAGSTALIPAATATLTQTIAMTALQKTIVGAVLALALGTGLYEAAKNAKLRDRVESLQQQQAPLASELQELQRERDEATNRLASLARAAANDERDKLELLRLRGLAGVARRATVEAEQLRGQLARQASEANANPVSSAMAGAMKQALEQQVDGRLARMTASLHLTPEQRKEAREILARQSRAMGAGMEQALSGKYDKGELTRLAKASGDPEAQIKALLNAEQQAAYPAYQQEEAAHNASLMANTELLQLQTTLGLTSEQQDGAYAALYQVGFNQLTGRTKPAPGDISGTADAMQWALEQKATALESVLTQAQMDSYRQQLSAQAKLVKEVMQKMEASGASQ